MEHEPRPPHGELAPPSRDTQDLIIDLRAADSERADINYYEQKYGHNPELLAQNVAIRLVSAIRDTETTLALGPEFDSTLHGQPSQLFIDEVIGRLTEPEKRSAYASLLDSFANYAGFSSVDPLVDLLEEYREETTRYFASFHEHDYDTRLRFLDKSRDMIYLLKYMSERQVDSALDNLPMTHEGGDMRDIDDESFMEFCAPFLVEPAQDQGAESSTRSGISGQVSQRLALEARHRFGADEEPDYSETSVEIS